MYRCNLAKDKKMDNLMYRLILKGRFQNEKRNPIGNTTKHRFLKVATGVEIHTSQ